MAMLSTVAVASLLIFGVFGHEHHHNKAEEEFDYVIVGGGLAGSVLANRLSASGKHSVLLLNVAGKPPSAYSGPVMLTDEFIIQKNRTADTGLRARILQPGYKPVPAFSVAETGSSPARWMGGSTLVALSLYLRDHPEAFNNWGEDWSWTKITPYFYRAENGLADRDYGSNGMYTIAKEPAYVHPLTRDFVRAVNASGLYAVDDLNTERGPGVGIVPVNQYGDGTKVHAYDAYMKPALKRSNLEVRHGVRADRLIIHDGKCRGVAYRELAEQEDYAVRAKKEVIVSSGYIYTPRLLFLSGIGDKDELEKVGLPVVRDLPAVGKHLTSARYTPLAFETNKTTLAMMVGAPISPAGTVPDPKAYGSVVQEAIARFRSTAAKEAEPRAERPDVVVTFMPSYYAPGSAPLQYSLQGEPWPLKTNAYTMLVTLGETEVEGSVTFDTASPDVSPTVTHEPLTEKDAARAAEAVAWAKKLGSASPLGGAFIENGAGAADMFSAVYDGRGTCRMGKHKHESVVNHELKVHDVEHLRIVDGSVIPQASPYLAVPEVLALAERAADMILGNHYEIEYHHWTRHSFEVERPNIEGFPYIDGERVLDNSSHWSVERLTAAVGPDAPMLQMVHYLAGEEAPAAAALGLAAVPEARDLAPLLGLVAVAGLSALACTWAALMRMAIGAQKVCETNYAPLSA